jgi:hypothetical protein
MVQPALLLVALLVQAAPEKAKAPPKPAAALKAAAVAPDDAAPPSVQDLRKLLDDGKPADVLKHLARLLSLRGKAAQPYDRGELLSLKAESHLRLRAGDAAAQAFHQAAEAGGDREQQAVARATELLIRRSRGLAYAPRRVPKGANAAAGPIDIVAPDQRKAALQAMFADDYGDLAPKVALAKAAKALPPRLKALQAARELAPLELAATGGADQVNGVVGELKASTRELMERVMEKTTKRVDQITAMANDLERVRQVLPGIGGFPDVQIAERRRGLKNQDIGDLKRLADTCDEVKAGAKALAQASGAEESEFDELTEAADDLRMHIRRMLRAHDVEY